MTSKIIDITVTGTPHTGKTAIVAIIEQALKEKGIANVAINNVDSCPEYYDTLSEKIKTGDVPQRVLEASVVITERYSSTVKKFVAESILPKPTPVVPVYRPETKSYFVDHPAFPPKEVTGSSGSGILTAPLKFGTAINLIGISETQPLLNTGAMNVTDSLHPAISLRSVVFDLGDGQGAEFMVESSPSTLLFAKADSGYGELQLDFSNVFQFANGQSAKVVVSGKVFIEIGTVQLHAVRDGDFNGEGYPKPIGFTLNTNLINNNRQ